MDDEISELQLLINEFLKEKDRIKVLEAGCGSSSHIRFSPDAHITGIDVSQQQLNKNTCLNEKILGDIQNYNFSPATFDVIMCWNVLEHLSEPQKALRNLIRSLKEHGIVVLALPNILSLKGLLTRYTPYCFHRWVYRCLHDYGKSRMDSNIPFKTFLRFSISSSALRNFAHRNNLVVKYYRTYESQTQLLKKKYKFIGRLLRLIEIFIKVTTIGKIHLNLTDFIMVLQKQGESINLLCQHYDIEREIADKLRKADSEERKRLYPVLYDELYKRVPYHPQLKQKMDSKAQRTSVDEQLIFLNRFLRPDLSFLEIGAGDCRFSLEVARRVKRVYAVDVSRKIVGSHKGFSNFELILSDGINIDINPETINIAYSNQLIEHIHPDDLIAHLYNIYKTLVPGGFYVCVTPHRFNGPHDISRYFNDKVAKGLHLKEYTISELYSLFIKTGFRKVHSYINLKVACIEVPINFIIIVERLLNTLPIGMRQKISNFFVFRSLLGIRLAAIK